MTDTSLRRLGILALVALLVLGAGVAPVAAQATDDSTAMGGSVVVDADQTVDGFTVMAGTIVVRGTVAGDLEGFAGDVVVAETGVIQGDLSVATGSLRVAGTVEGGVSAGAGTVLVEPTGRIGGDFAVGAGEVVLDGQVAGNAEIGADTIRLGPTAAIGGELRYDGRLDQRAGATVGGPVVQDPELGGFGPGDLSIYPLPQVGWLDTVYGLFANLLLGAVLLLAVPEFSNRVADRAVDSTGRSLLFGLFVLLGAPVLLVLTAITVIGIPLAVLGFFLYLFALWTGVVYGEYAVGRWLLARRADEPNRWYALVLGLLLFALLGAVPVLGGLFVLIALLLGTGSLSSALRGTYRRRRGSGATPTEAVEDSEGPAAA